ncbi:Muskelin [Trametes maxima]|nr:Muskelin [Trametes maxima]
MPEPEVVRLDYEVSGCSSQLGDFDADRILVDRPLDSRSRWCSALLLSAPGGAPTWIRLRLKRLSVLKSITFGKFHEGHPCTVKKFKVFAGADKRYMEEILCATLVNNNKSETFSAGLKKGPDSKGFPSPIKYIEIVPLS